MKTSDLIRKLDVPPPLDVVCEEFVVEGEETTETEYDDSDFWEALDLLETCRKSFDHILRYADTGLTHGRKKLIKNLSDDIGQFIGLFIALPEEESK